MYFCFSEHVQLTQEISIYTYTYITLFCSAFENWSAWVVLAWCGGQLLTIAHQMLLHR